MSKGKRIAALAAALSLVALVADGADAQMCLGSPSFAGQPFQVSAGGLFNDDVTQFQAGVAYGANDVFGGGAIGIVDIDPMGGSTVGLAAAGGYELDVDPKGRAHVCPIASLDHLFGPNDIEGSGVDYSQTGLHFGGSFGYLAHETPQLKLVPTAGLGFNVMWWSLSSDAGDVDDTETYFNLDLGFGLILQSKYGLRPYVSIPMGLEGRDASFGLAAGVHLGR